MRRTSRVQCRINEALDGKVGGKPVGEPLSKVGHVVFLRQPSEFRPDRRASHGSETQCRFARVVVSIGDYLVGGGVANAVEAGCAIDVVIFILILILIQEQRIRNERRHLFRRGVQIAATSPCQW